MSASIDLHGLLLKCVGEVVKTVVEPRCQGIPIWDAAGKAIAAEKLKEMGVPQDVTVIQIARTIGILGPDPNEIVITNPKRRRRHV